MAKEAEGSAFLRWSVTILLYIAIGMTALVSTALAPAMPFIAAELRDHTHADLLAQVMMAVPAVAIIFGGVIVSSVVQRFGSRRTLGWSLIIFGLAGTGGLIAPGLTYLFGLRLITGLAAGIAAPTALALLVSRTDGAARSRALGFSVAASAAFSMMVIMASSVAVASLGWRSAFAIYAIGFLLAAIAMFGIADQPHDGGAENKRVTGATAVRRNAHILVLLGIAGIALFTPLTLGPFLLRELEVGAGAKTGLLLAVPPLASSLMALTYGRLRGGLSAWTITVASLVLIAIGFIAAGAAGSTIGVVFAFACFGIGAGPLVPAIREILFARNAPDVRTAIAGWTVSTLYAMQMCTPFALVSPQSTLGPSGTFTLFGGICGVLAVAVSLIAFRKRALLGQEIPAGQ